MLFGVTACTTDFCCVPPTRSQAQCKGFPCSSVTVKVTLVSAQIIKKVPPPRRGCWMLKSVAFSSLTTGGPSRAKGEAFPSDESKTGQMPAFSVPDQRAPSITGRVPYSREVLVSAVSCVGETSFSLKQCRSRTKKPPSCQRKL